MSLATYDDFKKAAWSDPSRAISEVIIERIKGLGNKAIMPPSQNGRLSAEEIAMVEDWVEAGMPEGRPSPQPPSKDGGVRDDAGDSMAPDPEAPFTEVEARAPRAVVRTGTVDEYGCFSTTLNLAKTVDAVELSPIIDQAAVVHHILVFRDRGKNYPAQKTGLLCAADTLSQTDWELLYGWAPGGTSYQLPKEAGVRLRDGDQLVVQIHYNNPTGATVMDSSGVRFKATEKLRANEASVVGVGTQSFSLPAGQTSVSRTGECTINRAITIFGDSPHMHLLGRGARLELVRGGQTRMLAEHSGFTFETQEMYSIQPVQLMPGDKLRATCTWDTSGRTGTTSFGEGTTDEMCYVFVAHYPTLQTFACTR